MNTNPPARNLSRRRSLATLFAGVAMLATVSCGGGGGSAPPPPAGSPPAPASGGLYVGFYREDPGNPDPTLGVLHLSLPSANATFSGQMFFTYVGCQDRNVGTIGGDRTGNSLNGTWSGDVDSLPQSGNYSGSFDANLGGFSGTYTVAAGEQAVSVPGCIDYVIAANGTWELYPVGISNPGTFEMGNIGASVNWNTPPGTTVTLVAVMDEELALQGQEGALVSQTIQDVDIEGINLASLNPPVISGRRYIVAVVAATSDTTPLAAGSVVVTAP